MDFSTEINDGWKFGLNTKAVAARLRELADKIEKAQVILEDFEVAESYNKEDLQNRTLYLNYNEKIVK